MFVTDPGTVTGITVEQVLPVVVSVTPVMVCAVGSVLNMRFAPQASLAMRLANAVAIFANRCQYGHVRLRGENLRLLTSSCFIEMIGQSILDG